ncbi:hypothetical protein K9O30_20085 [Clostridium bowmanii]|uniref:hypothetical protein n=1 Tax=Clostridium bowmanii TaxID=132925 RepID=UPI001C0D9E91|nr:hypothetical protein [Clostridium bowmanii]MBU3191696.1 hypothetical protein [Clostridium bowmanii]MCA1075974.1 hypothetical protein [Clostridium bowmanii]
MKNRKGLYLLLGILLIAFFGASYSIANYINENNIVIEASSKLPYLKFTVKSTNNEKNAALQTSVTTNMASVAKDTKFVFNIKYKDKEVRNMVLEKHFNESTVLNNKTQKELDEFFKTQGYIVDSITNAHVVFVNYSDRYSYSANRYFLGVYNDLVTIYKTDENGDITAHKVFNSNVYSEDGSQQKYDFGAKESGELQYIRIDDLKEKDGLVGDLIKGRKYINDSNGSQDAEVDQEYEKGEFKTPEKAFDYARGLLKS